MKASNNKEEKPHFVKRDKFAITAEYKQCIIRKSKCSRVSK